MRNSLTLLVIAMLALAGVPAGLGRQSQQTPQTPQVQAPTVIRAQVNLVNLLFSAFDKKGKHVEALNKNDVEIFEDGVKQNIEFFRSEGTAGEAAQSLTIVLLVDTSGSVKDKLGLEQIISSDFFRNILRPKKDLAAIIQFDSEVALVQDFTDDLNRLDTALHALRAGGSTMLYDAVYIAAGDVLKAEAGRKVIIILSDGADTASRTTRKQSIDTAQKNDVIIFGIGVKSPEFPEDFGALKELSRETGGQFFNPKTSMREITEAFQQILNTLKKQYNVSYY
ncbi:MAG TPA: VWA domain-containing protein, partial [Acidobacteriota bacterium]|nr:VWA domain-containing protein [Acidobacteriota bacterium]